MGALLRHRWVVVVSILLLGGCSAARGCRDERCSADRAISAEVGEQLAHYPVLSANNVRIQTLHRIVYLTGTVDTDLERLLAVSVAEDVQGVTRVVDSISVNNVPR